MDDNWVDFVAVSAMSGRRDLGSVAAKSGTVDADSEVEDAADAEAARSPGVSPAPSPWDSSAVESAMAVAEAYRQD